MSSICSATWEEVVEEEGEFSTPPATAWLSSPAAIPYSWEPSLKGQCHEIFDLRFFHESVSPKHLSIPLVPFQIFLKNRGDIHSSRCTTGVIDTGGKC
jgi:hypothetical protein